MTVLNVPDMHCNKCVERITNALNGCGLGPRFYGHGCGVFLAGRAAV